MISKEHIYGVYMCREIECFDGKNRWPFKNNYKTEYASNYEHQATEGSHQGDRELEFLN